MSSDVGYRPGHPLGERGDPGPTLTARLRRLHQRPICRLIGHPVVVLPSTGWSGSVPARFVCVRCHQGWVNFPRGMGAYINRELALFPDRDKGFHWAGGERHTYDEWYQDTRSDRRTGDSL